MKLEARKTQICGGLLKIQGKASIVIHKLRTSLGDSKQSTEKINGLKDKIESIPKTSDHSTVDYRKLYKEVDEILKAENLSVEKEIKEVMDKIHGWYSNMDTLTEEMDCDLITKKELSRMKAVRDGLQQEVISRESMKKKLEEEIQDWKKKLNDYTSIVFYREKNELFIEAIVISAIY